MKKKILIVDNDKSIIEAMRGLLEDFEYEIALAKSAKEFKQLSFSVFRPDIIILDIMLDGGHLGPDVYDEAVENGLDSSIPVIYVSGLVDEEMQIPARENHHYALYQKPIRGQDLLGAIDLILDRPKAA